MPSRRLLEVPILASIFIIVSLAINSCTSVESVTISNISQADSTEKTKIEVVLDGEIDKTQIAEFVESFGTAVAEGETLTLATPTHTPLPQPTRIPRPTSSTVGNRTNPVPYGDQYLLETRDDGLIGITVGRVIFDLDGSEFEAISDHYFSVNEPPEGEGYIWIELHLVYLEGSEDKPYETSSGGNRLFGGNRLWGGSGGISAYLPASDLKGDYFWGHDIFPGAEVSGWLGQRHMPVEFMHEALLEYSGVYFDLPDLPDAETDSESDQEDPDGDEE